MMLYFELLRETISVIGFSLLLTIFLYVLLSILLWKQNKYNLKNIWFFLGSIILVPFVFFELSLYLAANKVDNKIVEPAQEYACSFASKIDNYSTIVPSAVNRVVEKVVNEKSETIKQKTSEELSSIINEVHDSLNASVTQKIAQMTDSLGDVPMLIGETVENSIDILSDSALNLTVSNNTKAIDETTELIVDFTTGSIDKAMDKLPTNLVGELKNKFPALSIFLTDKGIEGENSEEIVSSVFNKATLAIQHFKQSRMKVVIKFILTFTILSLLLGTWKQKCKAKKEKSLEKMESTNERIL